MAKAKRQDETIGVGADTKGAVAAFKRMSVAGKAAVAALVAFATTQLAGVAGRMLDIFREQERAEIRLRRALVSSGQYSRDYEQRLHEIANAIQRTTTTGDEAAQKMIAQFVSIGRVGPDSIEQITRATLGFAELQGRSADRVARSWARSLADIANSGKTSIGELEQLFSEAEIAQIRQLKAAGDGARAQALAIDLLNRRYGEQAAAIEGSTDVYKQLGNAIGDMQEEAGRLIHHFTGPIAERAIGWAQGMVDIFRTATFAAENFQDTLIWGWLRIKGVFTDTSAEMEAHLEKLARKYLEFQERITAGGAATTGPQTPTPAAGGADPRDAEREAAERQRIEDEIRASNDRQAVLRATLRGRRDAEVEYIRASLEAAKQHQEALRLLDDERTRALGEQLVQEAALKQEMATVAREQARAAEAQAFADELAAVRERQAQVEQEEAEHQRRLVEIDQRAQEQRRADQLRFLDDAARIGLTGNKRLDAIVKTAARARLLVDLATKPFEAYAKTSAAYPWPLGPVLGAAHAAIIAAQVGVGLAAVGGGGGGSSRAPAPVAGEAPTTIGREADQRPIVLHATIEADGESIARVVQRRLDYADD